MLMQTETAELQREGNTIKMFPRFYHHGLLASEGLRGAGMPASLLPAGLFACSK
jgi:hypothetical protein